MGVELFELGITLRCFVKPFSGGYRIIYIWEERKEPIGPLIVAKLNCIERIETLKDVSLYNKVGLFVFFWIWYWNWISYVCVATISCLGLILVLSILISLRTFHFLFPFDFWYMCSESEIYVFKVWLKTGCTTLGMCVAEVLEFEQFSYLGDWGFHLIHELWIYLFECVYVVIDVFL